MNLIDFVYAQDGAAMTDSMRVAEHFGKRHDNVLRDYDRLECSDDFRRLNFEETIVSRQNPKGGAPINSKLIRMTKDGFIFMVMGFTGKKAARIKEAYIGAFNAMASELMNVTLTYQRQMQALELRDADSFQWASWGAKKMVERRNVLPEIKREYADLMARMQPGLFMN